MRFSNLTLKRRIIRYSYYITTINDIAVDEKIRVVIYLRMPSKEFNRKGAEYIVFLEDTFYILRL